MTSNDTNEFKIVPNANRLALGPAGLTKREYIAAMAMQGLVSNHFYLQSLDKVKNVIPSQNDMLVREAIDMADELLKQLG
jgi:hypothetical protein